MTNKISNYSSRLVEIAWGGHIVQGLAENGLEITPNSDLTENESGMDGSVATSINPDNSGMIIVRLAQNSPSNAWFVQCLDFQRITGDLVVANMTFKDPSGSLPVEAIDVHINKRPTMSRGKTASGSTHEWGFYSPELIYRNKRIDNNFADTLVEDILQSRDIISDYLRR